MDTKNILIKNNLITKEVVNLIDGLELLEKNSEDILQELANSIGQIDFKILAFPDITKLENDIEILKPFVFNKPFFR